MGGRTVLDGVFARLREDAERDHLERIDRAEIDLLRCVDEPGDDVVPAVAVLMSLRYFLAESELGTCDAVDIRLRLRLALELSRHLARDPGLRGVDLAPALRELEVAWSAALRRLRAEEAAARLGVSDV